MITSLVLSSGGFGAASAVAASATARPPSNTPLAPATETKAPDPCDPQNLQILVVDFNRIARAFDDLSVVAQNTPREQLAPIITQLQTIRRNSEDYNVPECMAVLKELQLSYMNVFNDTLLSLYVSVTKSKLTTEDVAAINQGMAKAIDIHDQYLSEIARLLGVTPSNPTPLPATGTPEPTIG